ncbi:substrate-specific activator of APC-dependent proteolysis [Mortierella claussenii]|nr:substrate-specific activator of APC-dependent proteolysis [Mortierella claussenii]
MDEVFKRRVEQRVETFQRDNDRPASGDLSQEHSATRNNHTLPAHQPGLVSPEALYSKQAGRTTGGAIRTSAATARKARTRGLPGTSGSVIHRSVFGPSASSAIISAPSSATSSPSRPAPNPFLSPTGRDARTRRASNSGLPGMTTVNSAPGTPKKNRVGHPYAASEASLNNINNNNVRNMNTAAIDTGSSGSIDNIHNNISTDSARNIANQHAASSTNTSANIPSTTYPELLASYGSTSTMRSPGLKSPTKKQHYDRFIPVREGNLSEVYSLLPETPSTPSRLRTRNMPTVPSHAPQTIDHYKKAQDQAHDTVIANELMLTHSQGQYDPNMSSTPRRLFSYQSTTTHNTMHFDSPSRQIYAPTPVSQESRNILLSPKKAPRYISKMPFKVLDAPDLRDDFYLNLVDWSAQNVLGVGLGSAVYLWSALTSKVTQLCDLGGNDNVTSISWMSMGSHLAVGTDKGTVQIWDVKASRRVRTMTGHTQRVGVLAFSDHVLTSGSRDRNIYQRDVRCQEMWQRELSSHTGEVCGLKWNSSGTQLASGGNDNKLMVWEKGSTVPLYKFRDHNAAVKAIDWNPHQSGVLASGGGTADRHIRFWNTTMGVPIGATDTGSQVCNLAWSRTSNELVSTHGYSQNQVVVWKYPSMTQITALSGHTLRVLYLALSPDGQTIVTGAGDETLRFWNVFQKSKSERRDDDGLSNIVSTIR